MPKGKHSELTPEQIAAKMLDTQVTIYDIKRAFNVGYDTAKQVYEAKGWQPINSMFMRQHKKTVDYQNALAYISKQELDESDKLLRMKW